MRQSRSRGQAAPSYSSASSVSSSAYDQDENNGPMRAEGGEGETLPVGVEALSSQSPSAEGSNKRKRTSKREGEAAALLALVAPRLTRRSFAIDEAITKQLEEGSFPLDPQNRAGGKADKLSPPVSTTVSSHSKSPPLSGPAEDMDISSSQSQASALISLASDVSSNHNGDDSQPSGEQGCTSPDGPVVDPTVTVTSSAPNGAAGSQSGTGEAGVEEAMTGSVPPNPKKRRTDLTSVSLSHIAWVLPHVCHPIYSVFIHLHTVFYSVLLFFIYLHRLLLLSNPYSTLFPTLPAISTGFEEGLSDSKDDPRLRSVLGTVLL